jgi:hypothetical protein
MPYTPCPGERRCSEPSPLVKARAQLPAGYRCYPLLFPAACPRHAPRALGYEALGGCIGWCPAGDSILADLHECSWPTMSCAGPSRQLSVHLDDRFSDNRHCGVASRRSAHSSSCSPLPPSPASGARRRPAGSPGRSVGSLGVSAFRSFSRSICSRSVHGDGLRASFSRPRCPCSSLPSPIASAARNRSGGRVASGGSTVRC